MINELADFTTRHALSPMSGPGITKSLGDGMLFSEIIGDGLGGGCGIPGINQSHIAGSGYGDWGYSYLFLACPDTSLLEAAVINLVCRMQL